MSSELAVNIFVGLGGVVLGASLQHWANVRTHDLQVLRKLQGQLLMLFKLDQQLQIDKAIHARAKEVMDQLALQQEIEENTQQYRRTARETREMAWDLRGRKYASIVACIALAAAGQKSADYGEPRSAIEKLLEDIGNILNKKLIAETMKQQATQK